MTTSRLCSTRRLAFSITMSATCTWRAPGSSKLDQRKIFFPFMRGTHLAADGVAGFQVEFADLRRRNVNVVGAGKVIVVRRTQKAVAIRQDFQHSFSKDVSFFFALSLQDFEDEV